MKIKKEDVIHVANLARLELDAAALDRFAAQVGQILEYVDTLEKVDTRISEIVIIPLLEGHGEKDQKNIQS